MPASHAIRSARTALDYGRLEDKGLVRIVAHPEQESHDISYVDTWGLSDEKTEREKKKIWDLIDREGLYFYTAEFRKSPKHIWEQADSIGDVIGDLDPTGYGTDLRASAVEQYRKTRARHSR